MGNPSDLNEAGRAEFAVSIVFGFTATFTTLARLWIRIRSDASWGWEDFALIVGLISYYGLLAVNNWGTFAYGGISNDLEPTDPGQIAALQKELKALYFAEVPFAVGVTAIRLSALFLYRRLFPVRWMRLAVLSLGIICIIWCLFSVFVSLFVCHPMSHFWEPLTPGYCLSTYSDYYLFKEIFATVLEAVIVVLPLRVLHTLHMTRRQKVLLSGVFLIGTLVVITNAVRAAVVFNPDNGFLSFTAGMTWSNIHLGVACTCVSLPLMRTAFSRLAAVTADGVQRYGYRLRSLVSPSRGSGASRGSQNRTQPHTPPSRSDESFSKVQQASPSRFATAEGTSNVKTSNTKTSQKETNAGAADDIV